GRPGPDAGAGTAHARPAPCAGRQPGHAAGQRGPAGRGRCGRRARVPPGCTLGGVARRLAQPGQTHAVRGPRDARVRARDAGGGPDRPPGRMKRWRAIGRVVRAVAHVVRGLWTIRTQFGRLTHAQSQLLVREWSRRMLTIMGIELVVHGEVPSHGPLLQVANHLSWLDILVMNAVHPSRFVSKADAQHWPLLGSLI